MSSASGEVIPNFGSTKVQCVGTLNRSPVKIGTQVAEITKQVASADEMDTSRMMHTLEPRAIRELVKTERVN